MKTRNLVISIIIIGIILVAVLGYIILRRPIPSHVKDKEVKVGLILPLTGPNAITGLKIKNGYDFAVDEINTGGGVKSLGGAKIKLIYSDTEGKPDVGVSEMERLISREKVVAIMGCFQSSVAMPTTATAERYRTPYIVGNPMADEITERGFKYIFRITAKASWMARDQMRFLEDMGKKTGEKATTLGLLYEDTDYGQSTAKGQRKYAKEKGFKVTADLPYPSQALDLTATLSKLKATNPDVILPSSYDIDAVLVVRTMAELGYKAKLAFIGSTAGYINPHFIENAGELSEKVITISLWNHDLKKPGARKFYDEYKERFKEDPVPQDPIAYAATYVLKDALERASSMDKEKLREALTKTDITSGPVSILPFDRIRFDDTGQNDHASLIIVQIIDGKYVTIWPFDKAAREPIWPAK